MMSERVIDLNVSDKQSSVECHLMPCRIEYKGRHIKSKEYFSPTIKPLVAGGDEEQGREKSGPSSKALVDQDPNYPILTASFRGKPLQGRKVRLPHGYSGFVVNEDQNSNRKVANKKFQDFTYWNWDELPTNEDSPVKALQWITIANSIHGNSKV